MFDAKPTRSPTKVIMIPSVSGGIGHISRTAALARALQKIDPQVEVDYLLDIARLRPFNIDATRRMGYRPRFLPLLTRENRDAAIRACLDDADIVVDDCARYLVPLRRAVPHARWVTLAMHPVADELFMDWPMMAQMDAVIWPYAPLMALPSELDGIADSVVRTGPFLDVEDVPDRRAARTQLGLPTEAPFILYAPRGFPFGREFGHRVLAGVYEAVDALRRGRHPGLRLVLLAVTDPAELRDVAGLPVDLPDWVTVKGVVTPGDALLYTRAANAVIGEGTSTMHEGAALRTPLVLVPGPIVEATLLSQALDREGAATVIAPLKATTEAFVKAFETALTDSDARDAMLERAHTLITGGGGAMAAARLVLGIVDRHRASLELAERERADTVPVGPKQLA